MAHIAGNAFLLNYVCAQELVDLVLNRSYVLRNFCQIGKECVVFHLLWVLGGIKNWNKLVKFLAKVSVVLEVAHSLFHLRVEFAYAINQRGQIRFCRLLAAFKTKLVFARSYLVGLSLPNFLVGRKLLLLNLVCWWLLRSLWSASLVCSRDRLFLWRGLLQLVWGGFKFLRFLSQQSHD